MTDIQQLLLAISLGIPSIILILTKCYKSSIFCILASMILGFSPLLNLSIGDGYAEERIHFTYVHISDELKEGNQDIVIKAIDETEMNSKTKNRYNLSERIRDAKEALKNN